MARDILGLGGPASNERNLEGTDTSSTIHESESERRRRRMSEGADEVTPSTSGMHRGNGATGIDMGAGGEGTDVE